MRRLKAPQDLDRRTLGRAANVDLWHFRSVFVARVAHVHAHPCQRVVQVLRVRWGVSRQGIGMCADGDVGQLEGCV